MSDTLPKLLCERASSSPEAPAFREKSLGIWRTLSWREVRDRVEAICLGLLSLGLGKDDKIAIVGDNRPDWIHAELAAQSLGAVPVGIYPDSVNEELFSLTDACDAKILIVEDQEQVDKVLEVRDRLHDVERIVYADERGMRLYDDPMLMPLSELCARGEARREPGGFAAIVERTTANDVALLATTSGTTGAPKLAMLTHGNLLSMAKKPDGGRSPGAW